MTCRASITFLIFFFVNLCYFAENDFGGIYCLTQNGNLLVYSDSLSLIDNTSLNENSICTTVEAASTSSPSGRRSDGGQSRIAVVTVQVVESSIGGEKTLRRRLVVADLGLHLAENIWRLRAEPLSIDLEIPASELSSESCTNSVSAVMCGSENVAVSL